jgi:hypothetical protein
MYSQKEIEIAKLYFSYNDKQIQHAIKNGELVEVEL